jgi:hypothetical protein
MTNHSGLQRRSMQIRAERTTIDLVAEVLSSGSATKAGQQKPKIMLEFGNGDRHDMCASLDWLGILGAFLAMRTQRESEHRFSQIE